MSFDEMTLLKQTQKLCEYQTKRFKEEESKAEKSLDDGIHFPIKPLLKFKFDNHVDLVSLLQDFYFTRVLHDQVSLLIDFRWLIQKENSVFTCSETNQDGRLRFDSAPHPQTFYKRCMRKKIHNEPYVVVIQKKNKTLSSSSSTLPSSFVSSDISRSCSCFLF
jgi:hypothetical protein